MDEKKNTPIKNIVQTKNDISNKKIFLLQPYKPINIQQVSSQFRECNKRYFANEKDDSKKLKQKNININYIKNNNFFRLHSASKNRISLSQEKENKNKKMHEDNLKKIKEKGKEIEKEIEKEKEAEDEKEKELEKEKEKIKVKEEEKEIEKEEYKEIGKIKEIEIKMKIN